MDLKGAMTEDIERCALLEPLRQALRPAIEQRLIYLHAWMPDIANEGKISGEDNLDRKIRLALTRRVYLLLLCCAHANRPGIHNHPRGVVLTEQGIQWRCVLPCIKAWVTYFHRQAQIGRPKIKKGLELCQVSWAKGGWQLQKHWPQ